MHLPFYFAINQWNFKLLLRYFHGTAIVAFSRIPFALFGLGWVTVFPNNLALCMKHLELLVFALSLSKFLFHQLLWYT